MTTRSTLIATRNTPGATSVDHAFLRDILSFDAPATISSAYQAAIATVIVGSGGTL